MNREKRRLQNASTGHQKKSFYKLLKNIEGVILEKRIEQWIPIVYLFGQTSDNQISVLSRGMELWKKKLVASILINDGEIKHGYPGFASWKHELLRMGVVENAILPLRSNILNENVNTYTEARALVLYARAHGWKRIYISASPFHQLRAFISTVSVLLREYPSLCVYNAVGTPLPWSETVRHSQGTLIGKRRDFLKTELESIYCYYLKGDLVPPEKVLAYL